VSLTTAARVAVALGVVSAAILSATACSRFAPEVPIVRFDINGGAHAQLDCEACHGPPPFAALPTDCVSCHEDDRKNASHYPGQTCNANGGCHSASDLSWGGVFGGTGETGDGFHDFLPLDGSHDLDCTSCHADTVNYADLPGQSDFCWSCHEEDRKPGGHYTLEDVYDPLYPVYRWDCGGCHVPNTWLTDVFVHPARIPHGSLDVDCNIKPETGWVGGCQGCHPVATTEFACYDGCHPTAHDRNFAESACLGCHVSAQPEDCDSLP
jgi:hypothetical protein